MARIAYTVTATLPDDRVAREYIAWLEDGHVDAVISGGAHSGMIVRLDPPPPQQGQPDAPIQVETRYVFATHELFNHYLEHVAPALRADGLRRFGPERGVKYYRRTGSII